MSDRIRLLTTSFACCLVLALVTGPAFGSAEDAAAAKPEAPAGKDAQKPAAKPAEKPAEAGTAKPSTDPCGRLVPKPKQGEAVEPGGMCGFNTLEDIYAGSILAPPAPKAGETEPAPVEPAVTWREVETKPEPAE